MSIQAIKPTITYEDFSKLDLRVGQVTKATIPDWSQKLIEMTVDFGDDIGELTIMAGIQQWYQPEDLVSNKFVFVINLAERKMGPAVSQGMMLMVDDKNHRAIKIELSKEASVGDVIC